MLTYDQTLDMLRNRIDLEHIPFTERGSRILLMKNGSGLCIRLVERWNKIDPRLSGYRLRPPIVEGIVFIDAEGHDLEAVLESFPHRLNFRTRLGEFAIAFEDSETLLIALPEAACGLRFRMHVDQGVTDRRGGVLRKTGDIRRNLAYTTNRPLVTNQIQQIEPDQLEVQMTVAAGPSSGLLINLTPRLGFNRYIPNLEFAFEEAARRWGAWFAAAPSVAEPYQPQSLYAWWIMRAGLISTRYFMTRESMTPSKIHYVGVWQWDAFFHALAYRHIDRRLAQDQIRVVLDHQRPDGMIPDAIHDEGTITHLTFPVDADVTKPPLLAWVLWKLYQTDGDREFLEELYEPVVRWNRWWFENCDPDGDGLCEYLHPFSSGLDDNPIWDTGMPVTSPDLNTYLVMQMENLGRIADVIGLQTEARAWEEQAEAHLQLMIRKLWDEKTGLFWAQQKGRVIPVITPFNLFPLITGRLPAEIARSLVAHLTNPTEFWTKFPIPTVSVSDPRYNPLQMWRGPTWINVNYMLVEGLLRSGFPAVARELRRRTLDLVMRGADIYEFYHPETGDPGSSAATMFGWSASLFIEMALDASQD
ncbi:glycogen debranching enzyme [Longilinea arvoryzae]|uniref:Glycogen debranching enzyme n=1 Tax=Longilinea arvoryzae TaxID=360412 RepID=A0A0S7B9L6_9CHLR|nr:trehalase family glycosidase [Longilinea arvoryzae]GAP13998.1 glycogen debranching enzyme [Longilinea arvoryzae]